MDESLDITPAIGDNAVGTVSFLQQDGVKRESMCHNWEGIMNVKDWLIKPGIRQRPHPMSMGPGMHNTAETNPDPWRLLYLLGTAKMMPQNSVIGISTGGRDGLPLSGFGI